MKFYLMHKDIQVASMNINGQNGLIVSIFDITAPEHLPVGVNYRDGKADKNALDQWWKYRCIPEQRKGIDDALIKLKVQTEMTLAVCPFIFIPFECHSMPPSPFGTNG